MSHLDTYGYLTMFLWTETCDSLRQQPSIWRNELTQQQHILEDIHENQKTESDNNDTIIHFLPYLRAEEFTV